MPTGTVKWFDVGKGYGFILNAQGKDVFVHFSSILGLGFKHLKEKEPVEYEETVGPKGLHARNVKRLAPPEPAPLDTPPRQEKKSRRREQRRPVATP